jgi:dihydroflavonol-4-reductase
MQLRVNVDGAAAAVRAAARAGIARMVFTSSAASVGEPKGTVGDEDTAHRGSYLSIYDRSKHLAEQAVFAEARQYGVEVVAVNPSSVQGPGRASGNGKIILAYLNGKLPVFVDTYVSVVDIADTVEGHLLAAERGQAGERYLLNGMTLTLTEALALAAEVAGVQRQPRLLPRPVATVAAGVVEGGFRLARRSPPVCREMVRTLLHGHRYDGSRSSGVVFSTSSWLTARSSARTSSPAFLPLGLKPAMGFWRWRAFSAKSCATACTNSP